MRFFKSPHLPKSFPSKMHKPGNPVHILEKMAEGAGFEPADPFGIVRFRVECLKPDSATLPERLETNGCNLVPSFFFRKQKGRATASGRFPLWLE